MKNKSILITGASQGIGRAIALAAAQDSRLSIKNIVLLSRQSEALLKVKADIEKVTKGVNIFVHSCDLSQEKNIDQGVSSILKECGGINFLINNAGFVDPKAIVETTFENLETTFKINVFAPFLIVRKLISERAYPERIVNISSTAGMSARPGWMAYAASKAALINMSDTMAEELKPFGVKVVAIAPGRCATELRKKLAPEEDPSTIMQPEHVANVVMYLLSDMGQFVDKQCLVVKQ